MNRFTLSPLRVWAQRLAAHWQASPLQGLWQAWLTELYGLLPAAWRARWASAPQTQTLHWPLAEDALPASGQPAWLLLPADAVLALPLQLPAAAARDLHAAVGFELDKYTPFSAAQVHYVVRLLQRDKQWLQVLLVAVLHTRLEPILAQCQAQGLSLAGIDARDAQGQRLGVNLLPAQQRPAGSPARRLPVYLALAAGLLVWGNMLLWLHNREAMVARMQAEVTEQRQQVDEVQALRRELLNTQGAARYLATQKAARPTLAQVLVDLTGCLGADTWVEQLEVSEDGGVSLAGQSDKASALITRVKGCETLTQAHFEGIIQSAEDTGKERFSLRAQLREGVADATAP